METHAKSVCAALLLAGGLAACTTYTYDPNAKAASPAHTAAVAGNPIVYTPTGTPSSTVLTPATTQFRAGAGTVESVSLVHIVPAGTLASSASAGASLPGRTAYRVTVRMDDGGFQAVDQDNRNFIVGDRVSFTGNGELMRQ